MSAAQADLPIQPVDKPILCSPYKEPDQCPVLCGRNWPKAEFASPTGTLSTPRPRTSAEKAEREEATVWVSGLDKITAACGVAFCVDLSATPFYIGGSGYPEGSPFPWIVSDFALVDAIESGITKIPRLPAADNTGRPDPKFFKLWEHVMDGLRAGERLTGGKPKPVKRYDGGMQGFPELANAAGQERCVVSANMLSEGWDANNVTHILGLRAFNSQLLCEQVVGRGLRRMDYTPDPATGPLTEEYVDIFGVPFSLIPFKGRPPGDPPPPDDRPKHEVLAMPARAAVEMRFPVVEGFVVDLQRHLGDAGGQGPADGRNGSQAPGGQALGVRGEPLGPTRPMVLRGLLGPAEARPISASNGCPFGCVEQLDGGLRPAPWPAIGGG